MAGWRPWARRLNCQLYDRMVKASGVGGSAIFTQVAHRVTVHIKVAQAPDRIKIPFPGHRQRECPLHLREFAVAWSVPRRAFFFSGVEPFQVPESSIGLQGFSYLKEIREIH